MAGARPGPPGRVGHAGVAPMLVIQGLDDPLAVPANGHALREQLGGDRVEVVDLANASHAMLPEQPETIARELLAFLARHGSREG